MQEKEKQFWDRHPDRHFMRDRVYPTLGKHVKRVLDIGADWYDISNKDLFRNDRVEYWQIDPEKKYPFKCDHFLSATIAQVPHIWYHLIGYFDVVISYGVLGYIPFNQNQVDAYIKACADLLKSRGTFLLKLDDSMVATWTPEQKVEVTCATKYFIPSQSFGLPEKFSTSEGAYKMTFYTLSKK